MKTLPKRTKPKGQLYQEDVIEILRKHPDTGNAIIEGYRNYLENTVNSQKGK